MAPSELLSRGGSIDYEFYNAEPGMTWLKRFKEKSGYTAWLNPIPRERWEYAWGSQSIRLIKQEFAMFPLSVEGLGEALGKLMAIR
jgi:uncharacterized protein with von Willebrand factor type A (vWA) domain